MAGCCGCLEQFSLWEQMVKVYKYMSEILSVTHTDKDPADGTRKLSKMDIHHLQEQYNGMKQKQKLQTHIIVFKSGDNELILREPDVNTVQVNERVRKLKAFKEQTPVKEVTLELSDKNYLTKRDGTWHAHLNIHRMVQLNGQPAPEATPPEHDGDINKAVLFERLLGSEVQPVNISAPIAKTMLMKELHGDHQSISGFRRKSSLKNPIPASWSQYPFLTSKPTSPTERLVYYPFPQKKNPRISEAARKLGLYVTH
ncbi:uncharacterized protein C9orf152 homolog [Bufo gargarizans]|uniref:uncharacterized protein C9orf152 homolog n=1 Tax=Bufo gargarizans TaxID=30331 RepID=UPI001CF3130A|nr:uncharacterized protein C9orf152 homolog [Bufo gargarizans]